MEEAHLAVLPACEHGRGGIGTWIIGNVAAASMLPSGCGATDKAVATATSFHKEACPSPMRSKVLACGFLRDRKRLVRKFLLLKYLGMTGSCEFAGSCCEAGAGSQVPAKSQVPAGYP